MPYYKEVCRLPDLSGMSLLLGAQIIKIMRLWAMHNSFPIDFMPMNGLNEVANDSTRSNIAPSFRFVSATTTGALLFSMLSFRFIYFE